MTLGAEPEGSAVLEGTDAGSGSLSAGPWCLAPMGTGQDAAEHSRHPCVARTTVSAPRACNGHPRGTPRAPSRHRPSANSNLTAGGVRSCHLLSPPRVAGSWGTAGPVAAPLLQVDGFCPRTRHIPGSASHGPCPWHLAETPAGLGGLSTKGQKPHGEAGAAEPAGASHGCSGIRRRAGRAAAQGTSPSCW